MYVQAGNLPADAVLEATITSSYVAQVTAIVGSTPAFSVGDVICVDQSVVGGTILVPVQNAGDASQVVHPPPDGGTCVPNFAYTVLLDDGGRPLACNDGTQASLALTTDQAVSAMRAPSCESSLAAIDPHWSQNECASSSGCHTSPTSPSSLTLVGTLLTAVAVISLATALRRSRRHTG